MMDFTDYVVLETLEKDLNITTAAERLYITQPALTYRIKSMEKELETDLLIRTPKGVVFTSEGHLAVQFAKETLKRYRQLKEDISSMREEVKGFVNVFASPVLVKYGLPELLNSFTSRYPNISIYIKSDMSSKAHDKIMNDEVHVALIRGKRINQFKSYCLAVDPIILISKKKVKLKDLPHIPYIKYTTDATLEREIKHWWFEHFNTPPKTVMQINNTFAVRELVSRGLGFSILPGVADLHEGDYKATNLVDKNNKELTRESLLVYKEHTEKIRAAKAFIDFVKEFFNVKEPQNQ